MRGRPSVSGNGNEVVIEFQSQVCRDKQCYAHASHDSLLDRLLAGHLHDDARFHLIRLHVFIEGRSGA